MAAPNSLRIFAGDELGYVKTIFSENCEHVDLAKTVNRWGEGQRRLGADCICVPEASGSTSSSTRSLLAVGRGNGALEVLNSLTGDLVASHRRRTGLYLKRDSMQGVCAHVSCARECLVSSRRRWFFETMVERDACLFTAAFREFGIHMPALTCSPVMQGKLPCCPALSMLELTFPLYLYLQSGNVCVSEAEPDDGCAALEEKTSWKLLWMSLNHVDTARKFERVNTRCWSEVSELEGKSRAYYSKTCGTQVVAPVSCMRATSTMATVAVGGEGRVLALWDVETQKLKFRVRCWPVFSSKTSAKVPDPDFLGLRPKPHVSTIAFLSSDDENKVLVGGLGQVGTSNHTVMLYDIAASPRPVQQMNFGEGLVTSIAPVPSGGGAFVGDAHGKVGQGTCLHAL
eukprot:8959161-Pyramimonas_sp.AAC.2